MDAVKRLLKNIMVVYLLMVAIIGVLALFFATIILGWWVLNAICWSLYQYIGAWSIGVTVMITLFVAAIIVGVVGTVMDRHSSEVLD